MELRDLYKLSELIKENVDNGNLPKEILTDMNITLQFNPQTYYGIDKEFYYMTHNKSYEGFVHSENLVTATVNSVKFNILSKTQKKDTLHLGVE